MKAKLIAEKMAWESVDFDFNPDSLAIKRNASLGHNPNSSPSGPGATPSIFLSSQPKTLTGFGYLVGDDVADRGQQIVDWMTPGGGLLGALVGAAVGALTGGRINLSSKPPVLIFQWGTQIMRCVMKDATVTYERFAKDGSPDRAKVQFTLQEEVNIFGMLPTNPTSGGLPGRHRHVVTQTETIHSITTAAYGRPTHWRGVADANGIDDPFRVRPGDVVYLPNPNEIAGG